MIADEFFEFIPNPSEDFELLRSRTPRFCRIIKAPVKPLPLTRKDWASIPGLIAGCDDEIEALTQKLINGFRPLAREINPSFFHDFDGHGVNPEGEVPALKTSNCFSPWCLSRPSAIWLRHELWVQRKRTRFFFFSISNSP